MIPWVFDRGVFDMNSYNTRRRFGRRVGRRVGIVFGERRRGKKREEKR
tara:strand:+ start:369 stop:512 length:144 start_codon:yes stop_codon:yes gene_type:complete